MSFFFFQAEDGIRYGRVTGVQTCALPISLHARLLVAVLDLGRDGVGSREVVEGGPAGLQRDLAERSEERRVGKEFRSLWPPDHLNISNHFYFCMHFLLRSPGASSPCRRVA